MESNSNKRILKNTLFLYFRMLVIMGVSLYTVKIVLKILGEVDFGIYNVVGGVVAMFTFLSGTMASSSQRFFSYELGKNQLARLKELFSLNINIFIILIVGVVIIAETLGLWFVRNKLTIPDERSIAVFYVYQFSLLSFIATIISVPYKGLIIAHEKMNAYAYISIIEAILKLVLIYFLSAVAWDKLVLYGFLMFLVSVVITLSYAVYCWNQFNESRYKFYWNNKRAIDLASYSGWHFIGSMSVVLKGQGINILLNIFFNPVINAARAIAFQVNNAVTIFSNNFFVAVKPQIYKLYSNSEYDKMIHLVFQSSKYCYYLMLIASMPFILETEFILSLWLDSIPDKTVLFTKLVLINALIDSTNGPIVASVLATGKIKRYQQVISTVIFLNLPISYIFLKFGFQAETTFFISITISLIAILVRVLLLAKLIQFPVKRYFIDVVIKILIITTVAFIAPFLLSNQFEFGWGKFIIVSIACIFSTVLAVLYIGLNHEERNAIILQLANLKAKL